MSRSGIGSQGIVFRFILAFGLVVLARLAVSGNNRSVRFRHAFVGFVGLASFS